MIAIRLLDILSISAIIESIDAYIGFGMIGNPIVTIFLGIATSLIAA